MTKLLQSSIDRRGFLRRGVVGAAGIAAASLAACAPGAGARWTYNPQSSGLSGASPSLTPAASALASLAPTAAADMSMAPGSPMASMSADMDTLAEAVMKRFPEKTDRVGNLPLAATMDGSTKVFEITASAFPWQIDALLKPVDAVGYNGTWP